MPTKYKTTTTLIIVESPAKCKKIEEYLGPGYKCIATYGHLRTLDSLQNINIKKNFNPTYSIIESKKKQIDILREEIKNAEEVFLASDLDREGEAISYAVIELFNLPINTKRITFNEITESALKESVKNPRTVDMNLVHAQQARQILDLLVGFKVTPILWKLIKRDKNNALSAGRCQTPAVKLVYDNQKEIDESSEKKVYNIVGYFTNSNLPFDLKSEEFFDDEDKMIDFLDKSSEFSHIYTCSQPIKIFKHPPEPFTTSRLQQIASIELHYSPKETMRICQTLYEGGYITYMRTDSNKYSNEFILTVSDYIIKTYNNNQYMNSELLSENVVEKNKKKVKTEEAHEAIRCTNISLQNLPEKMDLKEKKMYKLIWKNTLESCMTPASFYSVTASISAPENSKYTYTTEVIDFPGWKIVDNIFSRENKEYQYLQTIKKESVIQYKKICSKVTIKGSKSHLTEARLVQLLEEKGIGRPSTFSSIIDKIQERGYVKKEDIKGKEVICRDFELENGEICEIENKRVFGNEKGKLVIQQLGKIVTEFLYNNFETLFDYDYTRGMESTLDRIAKGETVWVDVCSLCNNTLDKLIELVKDESKYEIKIDKNNTYMIGKYGPVIKCVEEKNGKEEISFKPVKKDINIYKLQNGESSLDDIVDSNKKDSQEYIIGQYQDCDVILRKGKFGLYASWGENSRTLKELGNRPIESITFVEILPILEKGNGLVREINPYLSIRNGPKGDYIFYKNKKIKKPSFYDIKSFTNETKEDYKICDITILKSWIEKKYKI